MITVSFKGGNYIIKDNEEVISFRTNAYDAIAVASEKANGEPFTINCSIPTDSGISRTFHSCGNCDFPLKINGSLDASDYDKWSKDLYGKCEYCNVDYLICYIKHDYLRD